MLRHMFRIACCCCIFSCRPSFVAPVEASTIERDKEGDAVWKPKTKSVAVFKNGLAFFTQEGSTQLNDGWCYTREAPPAAFGTLAVYATDPKHVVDIVGSGVGEIVDFDDESSPEELNAKRKRLQSFVGMTMKIDYRHESTDTTIEGKSVGFSQDYVIVKRGSQSNAIPIDAVKRMQLTDSLLRVHVADETGKSPAQTSVSMAYLTSGIVWIPEYTLKIIDERTAELTLRGTLVNDAEDLVNCRVAFVVGVPHFTHSHLFSPLAVGRAIRSIGAGLASATANSSPQVMTQIMNRAALINNGLSNANASPVGLDGSASSPESDARFKELLGKIPKLESSGAGGFTVYTKDNLTIRRGERTMVTLMTKRIPYGHRYRLENNEPIKHYLTLKNDTSNAWTTGPCLAMSQSQPLSEDLLKYTPIGSWGELQVTNAINIAEDGSEEEIDRRLKAHEPTHADFLDHVTVTGSIRLKSYEKQPVEVIVSKPVPGKPLQASDEGNLQSDASRLRLLERSGSIEWKLTLNPGESRALTYRYERFVPSK